MRVELQYGTGKLPLEVPEKQTTVIEPQFIPGLPDEQAGFDKAVAAPIGSPPGPDHW